MSVSAAVSLRVIQFNTDKPITPIETLEILVSYGWSLNRDRYVSYLPLGKDDPFDCISEIMNKDSLFEILRKKEIQSELIVTSLTWQDSDIGGSLFLYDEKRALEDKICTPIVFSIDVNRKKLVLESAYEMTDVNWYLKRLLPAFSKNGMYVEYFEYNEHR
jgi:hypothetical protein